jgi:hypothetical protein
VVAAWAVCGLRILSTNARLRRDTNGDE